jgi:hypothetical protein
MSATKAAECSAVTGARSPATLEHSTSVWRLSRALGDLVVSRRKALLQGGRRAVKQPQCARECRRLRTGGSVAADVSALFALGAELYGSGIDGMSVLALKHWGDQATTVNVGKLHLLAVRDLPISTPGKESG